MKLIQSQINSLLDRNAFVLAGFAFLGVWLSSSIQAPPHDPMAMLMKIEGLILLFMVIVTELSKSLIIRDKQSKRTEFMLANGVDQQTLVKQYVSTLFLTSFLLLIPALGVYVFSALIQNNLTMILWFGASFLILAPLACLWVTYYILYTEDLNRLNGIQMKAIAFILFLMIVSFIIYHSIPMIELYLGIKVIMMGIATLILNHLTTTERIVRSYY
ncbi:hypothetical protein D3H64_01825 [Atopobacter sp. AH10]|uniref:hypothetical protein n=1 Tax=Atopobacter sp. AH10 TaxID=2315861 RepID=UPI000EF268D5|nr:hypothetical protein [Atopobacter sp. AH10]RLK63909.1 hypothetical protein D3H64_01825 [Atopobacter sp. AH10]